MVPSTVLDGNPVVSEAVVELSVDTAADSAVVVSGEDVSPSVDADSVVTLAEVADLVVS